MSEYRPLEQRLLPVLNPLYGHGKRGTDGPILVFDKGEGDGTPNWQYFADQLAWMQRLADADEIPEPWRSKGIRIREYC